VQTTSTKTSNSICSTSYPQSYSFYSYKPRKSLDLFPISLYFKMSDSVEFFACRVHNLHVEIIKQIQASNEQYKL